MSRPDVVVGSGPSGVHAALTLLERGRRVELWDVGRVEADSPSPASDFAGLRAALPDPATFFLGNRLQAVSPPGEGRLFEYPPARGFLLRPGDEMWPFAPSDFEAFASFSRGGLAAGWGVNLAAFDSADLKGWPVSEGEWAESVRAVARRIPVAGPPLDRLTPCHPGLEPNQPAAGLSRHDALLMSAYERSAGSLERRLGVRIGAARLAVRTAAGDPCACWGCARCLWGCPAQSLYHPRDTLTMCSTFSRFSYKDGRLVTSLEVADGRATAVRYLDLGSRRVVREECGAVFLAAGALQSGAILLRTLREDPSFRSRRSELERTEPVMDTPVVKIPYLQLRMLGVPDDRAAMQFNRLQVGWSGGSDTPYVHGEILSLNSLLYHPLIEALPFGSRSGRRLFRVLKPALGVLTAFFPDEPAAGDGVELVPDAAAPSGDRLRVRYASERRGSTLMGRVLRDLRSSLAELGCVPRGEAHAPGGAGIHYAGTIPMGPGFKRCGADGVSNAYRNVYVCDGAAFPRLPAKSITLNLMAHAARVAGRAAP